ncbi:MAG: 3'-5' exonuclease, partial [Alistipes sp.]
TPEATSALDNIEELLNSMQLFKEQRDAEIRSGEHADEGEATIDEWLQNVMLMTDMDKDDPADKNKVTLMTVHSAKGLEYNYVYIVGLEENLFPSQRAIESPDGIEEERRLFYVALTRAKVIAVISYAETRFKWGNMEFSRPSCFLREIDPKYLEVTVDEDDERPAHSQQTKSGSSPIEELRRRFDYRQKQKSQQTQHFGSGQTERSTSSNPALVQTPRPSTEGMRRLGVRSTSDDIPQVVSGDYTVGQKVEHPKFGVGEILRIETLAT